MPFKKGQSGNPTGRPKRETTLSFILEQLADIKDVDFKGEKIARKQALAEAIWQKAIVDKDFQAIKYIYDRCDGTPVQMSEISGRDGDPVSILVEYVSKAQ